MASADLKELVKLIEDQIASGKDLKEERSENLSAVSMILRMALQSFLVRPEDLSGSYEPYLYLRDGQTIVGLHSEVAKLMIEARQPIVNLGDFISAARPLEVRTICPANENLIEKARENVIQYQLWCDMLVPCLLSEVADDQCWSNVIVPRLVHHLNSYELSLSESALRVLYHRSRQESAENHFLHQR